MAHLEIEIKSLLGKKENADALLSRMQSLDPACQQTGGSNQLNHYFKSGDIRNLFEQTKDLFSPEQQSKFHKIVELGKDFSVRTRQKDDEVLLVVKASMDAGTSANTVTRLEFEETVALSLVDLDARVLSAGYEYQAKWSRSRQEYTYKGVTVCLDCNAGYGYLAEFEKIVHLEAESESVRQELAALMAELGVEELSQERLARMFEFYNQNWAEYYGSDKTFTVE